MKDFFCGFIFFWIIAIYLAHASPRLAKALMLASPDTVETQGDDATQAPQRPTAPTSRDWMFNRNSTLDRPPYKTSNEDAEKKPKNRYP